MEQTTSALRTNHVLKGIAYTYSIESVLGQGSFGITYLATTTISVPGPLGTIDTKIQVAVKEFYMHEFCSRHEDGTMAEMTQGTLVANYAKKFRKEAENLAKLSHPNIVKVLEVFDANNTTYYAMEYISGGSLDDYVRQQGGLPEQEAIACIRQIGSALSYMHDHKMLHLDLKPSNVMRSSDGSRLTLIDFGLSKQYEENGNPESSTSIGLGTPGYAPIEQSSSDRDKDFAPTLDVYALGATFFKLLTGETPPRASDVLNEGLPVQLLESKGVSRTSINVVEQAMEPRKLKRLKTVDSLLLLLCGDEKKRRSATQAKSTNPPGSEETSNKLIPVSLSAFSDDDYNKLSASFFDGRYILTYYRGNVYMQELFSSVDEAFSYKEPQVIASSVDMAEFMSVYGNRAWSHVMLSYNRALSSYFQILCLLKRFNLKFENKVRIVSEDGLLFYNVSMADTYKRRDFSGNNIAQIARDKWGSFKMRYDYVADGARGSINAELGDGIVEICNEGDSSFAVMLSDECYRQLLLHGINVQFSILVNVINETLLLDIVGFETDIVDEKGIVIFCIPCDTTIPIKRGVEIQNPPGAGHQYYLRCFDDKYILKCPLPEFADYVADMEFYIDIDANNNVEVSAYDVKTTDEICNSSRNKLWSYDVAECIE